MQFKNLIAMVNDPEGSALDPNNFDGPMQEALKARQRKVAEAAADEMVSLLETFESSKSYHRMHIKRLRNEMEQHKKKLKKMDRAYQYGIDKGNFIPLLFLMGKLYGPPEGMTEKEYNKARKVPEDWQPPTKDPQEP